MSGFTSSPQRQLAGSRIAGGNTVAEGRFKFPVALLKDGEQFCGGTLIAPNVVLSSAICAIRQPTHVAAGCSDISELSKCDVIPVKSQTVYPGFNINVLSGDLQILVLERDSVETPVTLAFPSVDLADGTDLTVLGWGFNTDLAPSPVLLEANLELVNFEACKSEFIAQTPRDFIDDFKFCAAASGRKTCSHDEGGPILLRCDATGEDVQVGVISLSVSLNCEADDGLPGIFADLSKESGFNFIQGAVNAENHSLKLIRSFDEFCVVNGTQPPEELSDPPTPFPALDLTEWTCNPAMFNNRDGCDCDCGIKDPDCDNPDSQLFNCEDPGAICVDGDCTSDSVGDTTPTTSAPTFDLTGWIFEARFYASNDGCDCNCGIPDPDCEYDQFYLYGCGDNQFCREGLCVDYKDPFSPFVGISIGIAVGICFLVMIILKFRKPSSAEADSKRTVEL